MAKLLLVDANEMNRELLSACPEHEGSPPGSDSDGHRGLTRESTEGSGKIRSRLVRKPRRSLLSYPVLFTNFVLLWLAVQSPAQYTVASAAVAPALDRVLELDGQGSYVVLPENLLADLAEVTVEGWINWGSFRNASRFFDFGAGPFQINLQNRTTTSTLWFESPRGNTYNAVTLPDLLSTNEWIHIAAIRSTNGLQLMINGSFMPTVQQSQAVDSAQGKENFLGRSNYRTEFNDEDFQGRMAEVRVWNHVRTEAQVRANLSARLTGREAGLVALYNFADATRPGLDATGRGHDGKLMGNAQIVSAQLPGAEIGKDLTEDDHRRLNGGVERIIQKGAASREELLTQVRLLLHKCVGDSI